MSLNFKHLQKFMKRFISILFVLILNNLIICKGQVRDSVCIHSFTKNYWQSIRPIDSLGYTNYISNSEYFKKRFHNDSLYITLTENSCKPETVFIGEFTTKDSIRFIDFIKIGRPYFNLCIEGICSKFINRNQLPQIRRITLRTNQNPYKLFECDLYIQNDSSYTKFKIKGTLLPLAARNQIIRLKENQYINAENIKVVTPYGIRTINASCTYQIKN